MSTLEGPQCIVDKSSKKFLARGSILGAYGPPTPPLQNPLFCWLFITRGRTAFLRPKGTWASSYTAVRLHVFLVLVNSTKLSKNIAYVGSFKYFSVQLFYMYFVTRPRPLITAVPTKFCNSLFFASWDYLAPQGALFSLYYICASILQTKYYMYFTNKAPTSFFTWSAQH